MGDQGRVENLLDTPQTPAHTMLPMWPFTSRKPTINELRGLEARIVKLELEWSDVLDKLLHRIARQSKRDRDALQSQISPPIPEGGTPIPPMNKKMALRARWAALRGGNGVRGEIPQNRG